MKTTKKTRTTFFNKVAIAITGAGLIAGGLAWAAAPAGSGEKNDLAITLTARKVVTQPNGQEKLLPAEQAFPGEVIQYDALYVNQGAKPLSNVAPTLPIPAGMELVPDSAKPGPMEASLDGRTFQRIPLKRKVTMPTGEQREEEVPAKEYRALRWQVGDMASGQRATVSARTRLVTAGP